MTPENLFGLASTAALAGWLVLILAPRRWPLLNLVPALVLPLILSAGYAALVLGHFAAAGGGYGTLAAVRQLLTTDQMLLAGWVHYLAFDLIVGAVMAARLDRAGVGRLLQAPILACIFLFGPVGVVLTLLTEAALRLPTLLQPNEA